MNGGDDLPMVATESSRGMEDHATRIKGENVDEE